ncbi:glycosyltransferase [Chryseobacterium lacus]|uniref:Glycosyltransferase n=1 Tax=Chryseobacterium lacus TaxID=2058346 RepID=A0A368MXM7_9FLAO|nr:glycosyltransferase [Chryseobacterium lacus]RCU42603.1 glycosyltransferase [Chryseobacterium lacus]RST27158.1 glycosyltransferase [Chryseobacterium lacus]
MKIIFPIGAFFPCQIGGQASAVYWHVSALGQKDIACDVFTTMYGIDKSEVVSDQIIPTDYGSVYYSNNTFSLKSLRSVYEQIKKADLIHLSGMFNIPSTISLLMRSLLFPRKPVVCSVHGELSPDALRFSRLKKQPTLLLYRLLYKRILFHATSDKEREDITAFFKGSKVLQVPNLMHPADFVDKPKKKQFLFMGRIHEIKALHKFIKALALSKLFKNSDFVFDIAGSHEERHEDYFQELKKLITDLNLDHKVKFSGHITGDEKESKYAESWFLVLPSESENFGNVVVEALNQRTPVLASLGTPWSILESYRCGFHTSNVPENLALYIDRMIAIDSAEYDEYCQNAATLVNEKFNIETQISVWTETYKQLYYAKQ